jgi:hypothetical protein
MLADDDIEVARARAGTGGLDGGAEAPHGIAAVGRDAALRAVQVELIKEIDDAISRLERTRVDEATREHLEILRSLLKAQVSAYLEHFVARRATLFSHTSVMYAGEVGAPGASGVLSTTFRGLLEGGTFTGGQGAKMAQFIGDRRTLVIFGQRSTGKSTLLNSLFELVSVDDRFVAIERGPALPALKERSFCVRLGMDAGTDIVSLFAKARRMDPGRLVVGEIQGAEVRELFSLLAEDPRIGGMTTLRADTVGEAIAVIVAAFAGDDAFARQLIANVKPVFVGMHADEKGRPRLTAIWSVAGLVDGDLALEEVATGAPRASGLVAET